jgi:hypothetical protein
MSLELHGQFSRWKFRSSGFKSLFLAMYFHIDAVNSKQSPKFPHKTTSRNCSRILTIHCLRRIQKVGIRPWSPGAFSIHPTEYIQHHSANPGNSQLRVRCIHHRIHQTARRCHHGPPTSRPHRPSLPSVLRPAPHHSSPHHLLPLPTFMHASGPSQRCSAYCGRRYRTNRSRSQ